MIERLVLVGVLAAGLLAAVALSRAWAARRVPRQASPELWQLLARQPDGRPTVVAFSAARCSDCQAQTAILSELGEGVQVVAIDAGRRPEVTRAFGVVTAPTTVVIARDGRVVGANHGLASADRLASQLAQT